MTSTIVALPQVMDPMYWLGDGSPFGSAVLPGVMLIVFIETGLLFPFLPGDTLLFTAGLLAAQPNAPVEVWTLAPCAAVAAVIGGQLGYLIGRRLGPAVLKKAAVKKAAVKKEAVKKAAVKKEDARFFKKHYLTSSHEFFSKHGRKTIVIGHFVGVVRTFTPVIAGASGMRYSVFLVHDIVGAVAWGAGLVVVGYHLGGVSFVGAHLEPMVLAIAFLSVLPVAASVLRAALVRRGAQRVG
ncbi:MAG TPA: VTT domain-containing protein [Mycobacterium sp.]|nr:VTT domain-containing protein [Mycobacterium sp.]